MLLHSFRTPVQACVRRKWQAVSSGDNIYRGLRPRLATEQTPRTSGGPREGLGALGRAWEESGGLGRNREGLEAWWLGLWPFWLYSPSHTLSMAVARLKPRMR